MKRIGLFIKVHRWLGLITLIALLIRIGWVLLAPGLDPVLKKSQLYGDAAGYTLIAENMLDFHIYSLDGQAPTSTRMPGYPTFLAVLFMMFGENLVIVRIAQSVLGALVCVPVYLIGKSLGGKPIFGLVSAIGIALHPVLIYMTGWIYSETLFILLFWSGILFIIKLSEQVTWRNVFLACLFSGLAILVRSEIVVLIPFLIGVGFILKWRFWVLKIYGLVFILSLIILAPWSIRNTLVWEEFMPLTSVSKSNYYYGNNADYRSGLSIIGPLPGMSEPESDRVLFQRSLQWIRANPTEFLSNLWIKLGKFLSPVTMTGSSSPRGNIFLVINILYGVFLVLSGWGLFLYRKKTGIQILIGVFGFYLLIGLVFHSAARLALPDALTLMIGFSIFIIEILGKRFKLLKRWI